MSNDLAVTAAADATKAAAAGPEFRVICPGLGRTGTTTLAQCLNILGFPNQEVEGDWYWVRLEGDKLAFSSESSVGNRFRAWTDSPIPLVYRELADLYPDSRVILTVRPIDDWLRSVEGLVAWSLETFTDPDVDRMLRAYRRQVYGAECFDRNRYAEAFEHHRSAVNAFFGGRGVPVLELDITRTPDWSALCGFLDRPVPATPFPWRNRIEHPKGARRYWHALRRRGLAWVGMRHAR